MGNEKKRNKSTVLGILNGKLLGQLRTYCEICNVFVKLC